MASLLLSLPPCTLQGRAVTGGEAAVHQRGNWPWFIGGQSSQRELAQHWHEARQGRAVNISKPTRARPSPNPPTSPGRPIHHYSRSAVTTQEGPHVNGCMLECACASPVLCLPVFFFCFFWGGGLCSTSHLSQTHTHRNWKTCHKKWQAVSLNWRKTPLSSSSINSCWQSLCKGS